MTSSGWTVLSVVAGLFAAALTAWRPITVGRRYPLWIIAAAALAFVVNATIAWQRGLPEPRVQDEFSYLLAADTFARGRLANPTPPAWRALQSFHVLMVPAYASKYPPGQGLALAAGQVATGLPIAGAWLTAAALAAAGGWAAAGLVGPAWGVGVAVLLALHPQAVEWAQTYWGGGVAAVGGALVLGGWARLPGWRLQRPPVAAEAATPVGAAVAVGIGVGLLLMSRPYEGLAFAAPLLLSMRHRRALVAATVALLPLVAFLGTYNAAVTGRPWRLPYLAYERQYAAAPPLVVQPPRPVPAGIPPSMADYAASVELSHSQQQRSATGFVTTAGGKLASLARAALPSPWLWPLVPLAARAVWRDRRLRVVAFSILATLVATLLSNWTRTQYVAPATAAVAALLAAGAATAPRAGRPLWAAAVVTAALLPFGPIAPGPRFQRDQLVASLAREPGRQLVVVHYGPGHRPDDEWVYNDADPPAAKVVWTRDDGGVAEPAVRAAYPGRTVWHVDVTGEAASVERDRGE